MVNKETKSLLFIILVLVAIIIIGFLLYKLKVNADFTRYDYEGKNGVYHIETEQIGSVLFYNLFFKFNTRDYVYSFRNHPEDLQDIYLEEGLALKLNRPKGTKTVFVTSEADLGNRTNNDVIIAVSNFEQVLGKGDSGVYKLEVFNAYTDISRGSLPSISCSNVTTEFAVIYLKIGEESRIYSEGDCIVIQGRGGEGLIRAGEKFGYYLLGVF